MRLIDLHEKAMNSKTYAETKLAHADTAKVGFEFEMVIPESSKLFGASDSENREYIDISKLEDIDDIRKYFDISKHDYREMYDRELEWHKARVQDWVTDNWGDYHTEDNTEEEARELASKHAEKNIFNNEGFKDYLIDTYGRRLFAKGLIDDYDLEPTYGWTDDRHLFVYGEESDEDLSENFKNTAENVKESLSHISKDVEIFLSYHDEDKNDSSWYLEPDGSIDTDNDSVGIELVSPPMTLKTAEFTLKEVFDWMIDHDIQTNKSTGLHVNISIDDIAAKLDPIKLILFLGERHTLELFNRENNGFAKSNFADIAHNLQYASELPKDFKQMQQHALQIMQQTKYMAANLNKLSQGYIEFRAIGNANYHKRYDEVFKELLRFVTVIEIACDPKAEVKEYIKKLSVLFSKTHDAINAKVDHATSYVFGRIAKYNSHLTIDYTGFMWALKNSKDSTDESLISNTKEKFIDVLHTIAKTVEKFNLTLTEKELSNIKKTMKEIDLNKEYAISQLSSFNKDVLKKIGFV